LICRKRCPIQAGPIDGHVCGGAACHIFLISCRPRLQLQDYSWATVMCHFGMGRLVELMVTELQMFCFLFRFFFVSHYLLVKFRSFCSKVETPVSGGAWLHVCGCFRKNNIHVVVGSKRVEGCAPMWWFSKPKVNS
jgi:hypothetical protein